MRRVGLESESPGGEQERVRRGEPHLLATAGAAEAARSWGREASSCPVGGVGAAPSEGPFVSCQGVGTPSHKSVIVSAKPGRGVHAVL